MAARRKTKSPIERAKEVYIGQTVAAVPDTHPDLDNVPDFVRGTYESWYVDVWDYWQHVVDGYSVDPATIVPVGATMPRSSGRLTLFSFGYWGWGNSTQKLVEAMDTIERSRGFGPPIFVDIRIKRSVRAVGFNGAAFEKLLGDKRYRWIKSLGNVGIVDRLARKIQIADAKGAEYLLGLAIEASRNKQRVIFFCACPWPRWEGKVSCHRRVVANTVLAAARRQGINIEIVEWPGGKPVRLSFDLDRTMFRSVINGRMTIPLPTRTNPADLAGPPWGSIATFRHEGQEVHRLVGPAIWQKDRWCLPVSFLFDDADAALPSYQKESVRLIRTGKRNGKTGQV
jgi:hypothetical protein